MRRLKAPFATIVLGTIFTVLSGCAAVTITESGNSDFTYRPNYEKTKHFFLWGLIGEYSINTKEICGERDVVQLQTRFDGDDFLYTVLTGGLYLPRTARVWCKREGE